MSDDDPGQEAPDRRPDVWLAPGASAPGRRRSGAPADGSAPGSWRRPPAWRSPAPSTWQQPPLASGTGPSDSTPPPGPRATGPYAGRSPYAKVWPSGPVGRPSGSRGALLGLGISVGVLVLLVALSAVVGTAVTGRSGSPSSRSTSRSTPAPLPGTVGTVWTRDPASLRPGLAGAAFLGSLDGSFEQSYVAEVAGRWLTVSGSATASDTALHAFDPATGEVRWQRELDGVLCATAAGTLDKGGAGRTAVYCASVLERDRATGLGTRWRLHALDPATGDDLVTADVDAWVTAVHVRRGTFVLLEQRQPAPHAVVRGFSPDLRERWSLDLADRPGHAEMFTEDRVIRRAEPERPGLALDRPRLRDVGDGRLLAVWAGQRTAFVEPAAGRLVMLPHCSRLVDDGERLWCNEVDGASAYGYDGELLVRVRGPRLAFPGDDGVGEDRSRPVFLDDDGAGVSVDLATGRVGAAWTPPGRGSAFGQTTMPSTESAGGRTFLVGKAGAMLLDPDEDRVVWRNTDVTVSDVPIVRGDVALLGATRMTAVDLATGRSREELRFGGLYVVALGKRVAGVGPDEISLARW